MVLFGGQDMPVGNTRYKYAAVLGFVIAALIAWSVIRHRVAVPGRGKTLDADTARVVSADSDAGTHSVASAMPHNSTSSDSGASAAQRVDQTSRRVAEVNATLPVGRVDPALAHQAFSLWQDMRARFEGIRTLKGHVTVQINADPVCLDGDFCIERDLSRPEAPLACRTRLVDSRTGWNVLTTDLETAAPKVWRTGADQRPAPPLVCVFTPYQILLPLTTAYSLYVAKKDPEKESEFRQGLLEVKQLVGEQEGIGEDSSAWEVATTDDMHYWLSSTGDFLKMRRTDQSGVIDTSLTGYQIHGGLKYPSRIVVDAKQAAAGGKYSQLTGNSEKEIRITWTLSRLQINEPVDPLTFEYPQDTAGPRQVLDMTR
jgi:hypothetical protein